MSGGRVIVDIPQLPGGIVPVQIRDLRGRCLRAGLSSETMEDLPAGRFIVTARLPSGVELADSIEIGTGETTHLALSEGFPELPQDDAQGDTVLVATTTDRAAQRAANYTSTAVPAAPTSALREAALRRPEAELVASDAPAEAQMRLLTGNLLTDEFEATSLEPPEGGAGSWSISGADKPQVVEIATRLGLNAYVALPTGPGIGCRLEVDNASGLEIRVQLEDDLANVMLRYDSAGLPQQSRQVASQVWTAERLLHDKFSDPIAAAVGGYTLLRSGEVDRLHNWTSNLAKYFPWLPDGLVIYAEHLAQLGEHEAALEQLLQLPSRGLPFFSFGLSRALGRLNLYASTGLGGSDSDEAGHEPVGDGTHRVRQLSRRLQAYASACEFKNPLSNFTGRDPLNPGMTASRPGSQRESARRGAAA